MVKTTTVSAFLTYFSGGARLYLKVGFVETPSPPTSSLWTSIRGLERR